MAHDFDANGRPEIVVARLDGSLLMLDPVTAKSTALTRLPGGWYAFLAAADFDGNGTTDLLVANPWKNSLSFVVGQGRGKFLNSQPELFPIGRYPLAMTTADLNGDGLLDAVVVLVHESKVAVLLQKKPSH